MDRVQYDEEENKLNFHSTKQYKFVPQDDITIDEIAVFLTVMEIYLDANVHAGIIAKLQRHFKVVE